VRPLVVLWATVAASAVAVASALLIGSLPGFGEWWGIDGARTIAAAHLWLEGGDPYTIVGFLYPPLGFLLAVPWTLVRPDVALTGWLIVRVLVAGWASWYATRGWPTAVRVAATGVVLVCVPMVGEYLVGNVTILLAAAMVPVIYRPGRLSGVPLAVMFAAVPKPLLIPFFAWVLVRRRPMVVPMIVAALAATALATIVSGPERIGDYLRSLTGFASGRMDFFGNAGITSSMPGWLVAIVSVATVGLVVLLIRRADEETSAVAAAVAGLILTPYSGSNLAVIVLPPLSLYARSRPARAALVAACCVALPFNLPIFAGLALLIVAVPDRVVRRIAGRPDRPADSDEAPGSGEPRAAARTAPR
jgi:hypothetical protein